MRALGGAWLAALTVAGTICRAETQFPYEVTIQRDGVEVRSGPSADFYLTDRLKAGERIEVYRREPGGWLAIRPPDDSFSLVQRSRLKPSGRSVATVLRDGTTCRVGSLVADGEQEATHVLLHAGELVELLEPLDDDPPARADDEDEAWVRIWPPAGEFRWVRADDVQSEARGESPDDKGGDESVDADAQQVQSDSPSSRPSTGRQGDTSRVNTAKEVVRVPTETPVRSPRSEAPSPTVTSNAAQPVPAPGQEDSPTVGSEWRERADTEQADAEVVRVPAGLQPTSVPAVTERADSGESQTQPSQQQSPPEDKSAASAPVWVSRHRTLSEDLDGLELELAMMVSQEMRAWRLAPLRKRVENAASRLGDPDQQRRAQDLLARIGQFERLADRASGGEPIEPESDVSGVEPLISSAPNVAPASDAAVKYDGSGWLVPVHATRGTVPPYALLDVQGDVLQYVSPTPGLNLQRYLRKRIGVFGQQGYVRSLNKPHVTAERIVDLDRHLR